jgi:hypothetical protein
MRFNKGFIGTTLLLLFFCSLAAQEKSAREIDIHKNVKLIEMAIPGNMPEDLQLKYKSFLPVFIETLEAATSEQSSENALTFRIVYK